MFEPLTVGSPAMKYIVILVGTANIRQFLHICKINNRLGIKITKAIIIFNQIQKRVGVSFAIFSREIASLRALSEVAHRHQL